LLGLPYLSPQTGNEARIKQVLIIVIQAILGLAAPPSEVDAILTKPSNRKFFSVQYGNF
jgi:hypothetical protein